MPITIHTFAATTFELECADTRKGVIRALAAEDPENYPLLRTDARRTEQGDWFAWVLPREPVVTYVWSTPYRPEPDSEDGAHNSYEFIPLEHAFEPSRVERVTERQLQMARYQLPNKITLYESLHADGTYTEGIEHYYVRGSMTTYCCDDDHEYSTNEESMLHCYHSVQADGTCLALTQEAAEDMLRLKEVYSLPSLR